MKKEQLLDLKIGNLYEMYRKKVVRKERTEDELLQVLLWFWDNNLTENELKSTELTIGQLIATVALNPNAPLIKGVVCGVRVENVEDHEMQILRYMDKIVDELAKGKKVEKILRS
jgi:hypothetical protein